MMQQQQQQQRAAGETNNRRPTSVLSNSSMSNKQHKLSKRFTVIRKLGKGTYGKVQLAINKETGQEVAIKTIKKSKIDNEEDMQRVRREIQIMRSIEHPHIIHIYEEFENKDKIVLIMQYAPGGELYEYVSQSKVLNDGEARRLFRQIATAIYYCHQNKICHRDLKLENILLDEKNNAKLADFGLSNVFDKQNQLRTFCGSPLYASPEIVQGSPYKGPEVDCWSLGVLLYTLVYGAMPFDGSNFKRLVKQISDASYYEPNERSPASPLIRQLLCADPKERATIIDICSDPWVNGAAGTPMSPPIRQADDIKTTMMMMMAAGEDANDGTTPMAVAPQHPSLLKVAQDMANLTPVRIDMLLALTLGEQTARQQREEAALVRPPLVPIDNNVPNRDKPEPTPNLDPATVMEVDETSRAVSPIASYIVRDLEQPMVVEPAAPAKLEDQEETAEIIVEQDPVTVVVEEEEDNQPVEMDISDHNETETNQAKQMPTMDAGQILDVASATDKAPLAVEERIESSPEDKIVNDKPQAADQQLEKAESEASPQVEVSNEVAAPAPETQPELESIPLNTEMKEQLEVSKVAAKQTDAEAAAAIVDDKREQPESMKIDIDDSKKEQTAESQVAPEAAAELNESNEKQTKPKKVKKKIIVVKKKKKVTKKDADGTSPGEGEQTNDKSNDRDQVPNDDKLEGSSEMEAPSNSATAANKQSKPGKVKIPNTFQATEEQQTAPSLGNAQGRRQSALIADVSEKLLRSVSATESKSAAPTIIESDQLQLKNVRVSDKKDELERRTSLVAQQQQAASEQLAALQLANSQRSPRSISPAAALNEVATAAVVAAEQRVEALQAQLVREMQISCENTNTAQMDLIEKLEPLAIEPAILVAKSDEQQSQQQSQTTPIDEGSDSLETIRAASNSVRSSLQIDLSPLHDVCQEMLQTPEIDKPPEPPTSTSTKTSTINEANAAAAAAPVPAPITRSYKKVTFTKDGACITETGKIYSTKADDGTLRRIERKSKVTHYPVAKEQGNNLASQSKIHHREEEEEEEEVFFCENTNQGGTKSKGHLEKLIMPSQYGDNSDSDEEFSISTRDLFFGRKRQDQERQRDRTGSASSCSSGSTDVLEDIFDTWTGAISMFNRPSSRLFERAASRLSSGSFGQHRRHQRHRNSSSSQAGTPRCESVEPQLETKQDRERQRTTSRQQASAGGGYESDAAGGSHHRRSQQRRPSSRKQNLASSARGLFGSWNLLNELQDEQEKDEFSLGDRKKQRELFTGGFDRDPFEILQQEQRSLRERLAQQHKQLWKGSTPSLFHDFGLSSELKESISRKPPIVKDPRLPTGSGDRIRSTTGQVGQSQSSSSFKTRQQQQQQQSSRAVATPLEAAPIRRNTTNFSPIVTKSTSNSKTTATTQSFIQAGERGEQQQQSQAATTFIELKRTSSSLGSSASQGVLRSTSSKLRILQQQQQHHHQASNNNSISSSFCNNRETPPIAAGSSDTTHSIAANDTNLIQSEPENPPQVQSPARESIDRRVQSWLQESSGNLSATSSGSKSSQSASISDSLHSGRRAHDPFENLYGSLWQSTTKNSSSSSGTKMDYAAGLPPLAACSSSLLPGRSSRSIPFQQNEATAVGSQQQILRHSTSQGRSVVFSNKQSTSSDCATTNDDLNKSTTRKTMMFIEENQGSSKREGKVLIREGSSSEIATTRASSIVMRQTTGRSVSPQFHEQPIGTPQTAANDKQEQLRWIQQSVEQAASSRILTGGGCLGEDLDADSLSGDLESHSSSSLLDQLKAKGYRSMINKRMVDVSESMAKSTSATEVIDKDKASTKIVQESYSHSSSKVSKITQQQNTNEDNSKAPRKGELSQDDPSCCNDSATRINVEQLNSCDSINDKPNELIGNSIAENELKSDENTVNEEEEEEDEDVREAKASIKCHLDRVKETKLFLESLKRDEENYERQRQQMILFSDMMLSTKLSGAHLESSSLFSGQNSMKTDDSSDQATATSDSSFYHVNSGLRSAPVQTFSHNTSGRMNGFLQAASKLSSAALSFEPTYVLPSVPRTKPSYVSQHSGMDPLQVNGDGSTTIMTNDPLLEPVQPMNLHGTCGLYPSQGHDYSSFQPSSFVIADRSFRRSRSQLSDQFTDYKQRRNRQSLVETGPFPVAPTSGGEIYYPSRTKRSLSQLRYHSSANRFSQGVAMSEYRSAYGNLSHIEGGGQFNNNQSDAINPDAEARNSQLGGRQSEVNDDDDGMSAYRASSYVPKVVPTLTLTRGRSHEKRRSWNIDSTTSSKLIGNNNKLEADPARQRRTSLQMLYGNGYSASSVSSHVSEPDAIISNPRRSSLMNGVEVASQMAAGENSRLSELEQRIRENKRRREQLFAGGKSSPEPADNVASEKAPPKESSRAASPARPANVAAGLLGRPSRLESMEARIKRKSYCLRVGDCSPERAQMSLEKWRQGSHQASLSSTNRTDSLIDSSTNLLLSSMTAKRRSSIGGDATSKDQDSQ